MIHAALSPHHYYYLHCHLNINIEQNGGLQRVGHLHKS